MFMLQVIAGKHYQSDENGKEIEIAAERVVQNGKFGSLPSLPFPSKTDLSLKFPNKFFRPRQDDAPNLTSTSEVWDSEKETLDNFVARMQAKKSSTVPVSHIADTVMGNGGDVVHAVAEPPGTRAEIQVDKLDLTQLQKLIEAEELDVSIKGKKLDEARTIVRKALG